MDTAERDLELEQLEHAESWLGRKNVAFEIQLEKFKLHGTSAEDKLYSGKMFTER